MKRNRKKAASPSSASVRDDQLHFRLCHVCLHLNESNVEIIQCTKCQRYLTIESLVEEKLAEKRGASPEEIEEQEILKEHDAVFAGSRRRGGGLYGLAVLW